MEDFQQLRRDSLEHATLLWSLTDTPGCLYMYEDKTTTQVSRQLSIVHERQLADAFAFIASWKDDADKIVAVCIEEARTIDSGMVIRVASNTGNPSALVAKLQDVAAILRRASHGNDSRSDLQQEMLGQVVSVCMDRILSRLRSRHARKTRRTANKPRLPPQLLETLERCVAGRTSREAARKVVQQARELDKIFNSFEASLSGPYRSQTLMKLLKCASSFDINALRQALSLNQDLDPTLKTHLPNAISKLARYVDISQYLINAARKKRHSLFRNVEVRAVTHPAFNPSSLTGPFRPFHDLSRELEWQQPMSTSETRRSKTQYDSRLSDPTATWKVHAEIQILLFYEMEPQPVQPRIISASKLACFCCDLFIRSHGKFVVPGTHGRIYSTWILPDLSRCGFRSYECINPIIQDFISQLKLISVQNAARLGKHRSQPTESAILPLEPWSSRSTIRQASRSLLSVIGKGKSHGKHLAIASATSAHTSPRSTVSHLSSRSAVTADATVGLVASVKNGGSQSPRPLHTGISVAALAPYNVMMFTLSDIARCKSPLRTVVTLSTNTSTWVRTDALDLFMSVEEAKSEEVRHDQSSSYKTAFCVHLEDISKAKCGGATYKQDSMLDLDQMEAGSEYTIPVGVAATRRSIVLCNTTQRLLLSFNLPETLETP